MVKTEDIALRPCTACEAGRHGECIVIIESRSALDCACYNRSSASRSEHEQLFQRDALKEMIALLQIIAENSVPSSNIPQVPPVTGHPAARSMTRSGLHAR